MSAPRAKKRLASSARPPLSRMPVTRATAKRIVVADDQASVREGFVLMLDGTLYVSPHTVKSHINRIFAKTGSADRAAAARAEPAEEDVAGADGPATDHPVLGTSRHSSGLGFRHGGEHRPG